METEIYVFDKENSDSVYYFCRSILYDYSNNSQLNCSEILKNIILNIFKSQEIVTVAIEYNYVDKIYRDCYYTHFSGKHFEYSRYCKRVFLFSGDCYDYIEEYNEKKLQEKFIGCFVIKPLKVGAIGRTLINPKYMFGNCEAKNIYVRTSTYCVHFVGMRLFVNVSLFNAR